MTAPAAGDPLEGKRIKIYVGFLIATLLNNLFLAWLCLAKDGGQAMAAAPTWLAPALGGLGVATVISAVLALLKRKAGAAGVVVAGTGAVLASLVGGVLLMAVIFFLGTGFWALIARRNWYRLV